MGQEGRFIRGRWGRVDTSVLVEAALSGSRSASRELYMRYLEPISVVAHRLCDDASEANEAVQQTFTDAFAHLDRFDRSRDFGVWLQTLVRRRVVDLARSRAEAWYFEMPLLPDTQVAHDPVPHLVDRLSIEQAAAELHRDLAEVFRLRVFEDLPFKEIAERLNLPIGTVGTRFREARRKVIEQLGADDD